MTQLGERNNPGARTPMPQPLAQLVRPFSYWETIGRRFSANRRSGHLHGFAATAATARAVSSSLTSYGFRVMLPHLDLCFPGGLKCAFIGLHNQIMVRKHGAWLIAPPQPAQAHADRGTPQFFQIDHCARAHGLIPAGRVLPFFIPFTARFSHHSDMAVKRAVVIVHQLVDDSLKPAGL